MYGFSLVIVCVRESMHVNLYVHVCVCVCFDWQLPLTRASQSAMLQGGEVDRYGDDLRPHLHPAFISRVRQGE